MKDKIIPVPYGYKVGVKLIRVPVKENGGIFHETGTVYVEVHAPMYVNKVWRMSHSYSDVFTDAEILRDRDFIRVMLDHFPPDHYSIKR